MKQLFTFITAVLFTTFVFAQSPEKMSYQAVIRNSSNALVVNQPVGMKISILQGSVSGTPVYVEIFNPNPSTNGNGLVTLEIGGGVPLLGVFANINWSTGPYFIKTETDPSGGTNYTITGTSQLLSVSYALHAKTAETLSGGIVETDPLFTAWDKDYDDLINTPTIPTVPTNVSAFTNDIGYLITETQILSISNDTIYLTGGSFVKLPAGFDGTWNSLTGSTPNVSTFPNDAGYMISYTETDPIYSVSVAKGITGTDTTYWNNKLNIETDPLFAAWDKDYDDLINTPTIPTVPTNVSAFTNDIGYLTSETQILSISNDTIYLTGGSFLKLPAGFDGTWNSLTGSTPNVSTFPNDAGYMISYTETDPIFDASVAKGITASDTAYWNNKLNIETDPIFGSSVAKGITTTDTAYWNNKLNIETDPIFTAWDKDYDDLINTPTIPTVPTNVSAFTNDAGYMISYTETDPIFGASVAKGITATDTAYWNNKLDIETDPLFTIWDKDYDDLINTPIIPTVPSNVSAFTNDAGYMISYTETDPIFGASVAKGITTSDTTYWNNKLDIEVDGSITNEIQTISISSDTISLSLNGGLIKLPTSIVQANIINDSLFITYSNNQVVNVGYIGNGSPGSVLASVTTDLIYTISFTSAGVSGTMTHTGNELILGKGFCYGTNTNPTLANSFILSTITTPQFWANFNGLLPNTIYYVRAFVTNTVGTSYGNQLEFTTLPLTQPTLITNSVYNVSHTSAIANATITDNGGSSILESGVCWSTSANPTTSNSKAISGTSAATFNVIMTALTPNTTYYARSYAINAQGTAYGNEVVFTTPNLIFADLTTTSVSAITHNTATSGGNVVNDNGSSVTARGICWNTSPLPTTENFKVQQNAGVGSFSMQITSLLPNTTYYIRAFAINGAGIAYGNQHIFTTPALSLPVLTTKAISGVSSNLASSGGDISSDGGSPITAKGVVWDINPNPTTANTKTMDGTGSESYNSMLTGLSPLTTYYLRAYATNSLGTNYGNQQTFTTSNLVTPGPGLPILGTKTANMVTSSIAKSGGYISSDGGSIITSNGICWSTSTNPTIENNFTVNSGGLNNYDDTLTGLSGCAIVYYVRAYATNSTGTGYGNQVTVTTGLTASLYTGDTISVDFYSAVVSGSIIDSGGCPIIQKGICWSWSSNPTIGNFKTENGPNGTTFNATLSNLYANRTYFYRSYATTSVGTLYGSEKTFVTKTPASPYIGENYAGGIVFYIDSTGQHGLVCAPTDQGVFEWGCYGSSVPGTSSAIGTGASNTASIIAGCNQTNIAAKICDDLVLNSYSDWFLPSKDELNLIYVYLKTQNFGGFASDYYFSSSELSSNYAWDQDFGNGYQGMYSRKNFPDNVRAVRAF